MTKAKDLELGALVDLAGDRYADPDGTDFEWECEYGMVTDVELETPNCVLIEFSGRVFGFPPDHDLNEYIPDSADGRI